jgi:hypothetical protein
MGEPLATHEGHFTELRYGLKTVDYLSSAVAFTLRTGAISIPRMICCGPHKEVFIMNSANRLKPLKLSTKLQTIRLNLDLSQTGILEALQLGENIGHADISAFERGLREPPLTALLKYARLANTSVDVLIDDKLSLPAK